MFHQRCAEGTPAAASARAPPKHSEVPTPSAGALSDWPSATELFHFLAGPNQHPIEWFGGPNGQNASDNMRIPFLGSEALSPSMRKHVSLLLVVQLRFLGGPTSLPTPTKDSHGTHAPKSQFLI